MAPRPGPVVPHGSGCVRGVPARGVRARGGRVLGPAVPAAAVLVLVGGPDRADPEFRPPAMLLTDPATLIAAGGVIDTTWYDPAAIGARTMSSATAALAAARRTARALPPRSFTVHT